MKKEFWTKPLNQIYFVVFAAQAIFHIGSCNMAFAQDRCSCYYNGYWYQDGYVLGDYECVCGVWSRKN